MKKRLAAQVLTGNPFVDHSCQLQSHSFCLRYISLRFTEII